MISPSILTFIIIAFLLVYIFYLQFQLFKRNEYIKTIEEAIREVKASFKNEEVNKLFQNLKNTSTKESIHQELFKNFVFENEENLNIYLHYTREETVAKQILEDGFKFENTLFKTTEKVSNDNVELSYKHSLRRPYGNFVIVIGISKKLMNRYSSEIKKYSLPHAVEQVMTEALPCENDDKKIIYTLPVQYIKGFINLESGMIVKSSKFNPEYDSDIFQKNLMKKKTIFDS